MSRVLFCWELGANFGHLANISALRSRFDADNFEISFAVADLSAAREMLGANAVLYQAPVWPPHIHRGSRIEAASFADVLALVGLSDPAASEAVVDAWLSLITLVGPDVVVADHSPAAQLAARIAERRLVTLGSGFTQPPLDYATFPPLRADIAPSIPEPQLLVVANSILARRGAPSNYAVLPEVFRADARIVIGLPELDPYRSFRREQLCGPVGGFSPPMPPSEPKIFAYLGRDTPGLEEKIQALCDLPVPVAIYIRGSDPLLREFIRLRGKTAFDKPANMRDVLKTSTHIISNGGAMLASEALASGRPHLFLPLHREPGLNASLVVRAGYGRLCDVDQSATEFLQSVRSFVSDQDLAVRTFNAATVLSARPLRDAGDVLMQALGGRELS